MGIAVAVGLMACGGSSDSDATSMSSPPTSPPTSSAISSPNTAVAESPRTTIALVTDTAPLPVPADVAAESVTAVVFASSGFEIADDLVEANELVEADLLAQATAQAAAQATGVNGPQGIRRPAQGVASGGGMSAVGVLVDLVSRLTAQAGQPYSSSFDSTTSPSPGGTLKMGAKVSGDGQGSSTTEITIETKAETADGRTATQRISGSVTGPVCPDEFGLLDLEMSGEMEVTGEGPERSRHTFMAIVGATFDDNGEMADIDIELNVQSDRTGSDGRAAFVDATYGTELTNLFGVGATTETVRDTQINRTSQAVESNPQQADRDMIDDGRSAALKFVVTTLAGRRYEIQNNKCVVVVAEAPGTVGAKQAVPIEVKTRHVIEGGELDKRVEATLSGQGSIDPASLPKTPDTITYTAGEKGGDAGTISLVSRSRRGIGNTTLTVKVGDKYLVDAPVGVHRLQGPVCSLDEPFTLSVVGQINGTITFTPTGSGGGTYAGSADLGRGSMTWSGGYALTGRDTESPSIDADDGTTSLVGPITQEVPGFWQGGPDFPLVPDAAACP